MHAVTNADILSRKDGSDGLAELGHEGFLRSDGCDSKNTYIQVHIGLSVEEETSMYASYHPTLLAYIHTYVHTIAMPLEIKLTLPHRVRRPEGPVQTGRRGPGRLRGNRREVVV